MPNQWPTSNQERQLCCVRHITDRAVKPVNMRLHVVRFQPEVVTVTITDEGVRRAALESLTAGGFLVRIHGSEFSYA